EVGDLLRTPRAWRGHAGAAKAVDDIELLASLVLRTVHPDRWQGAPGGTATLRVVRATALDINTMAAGHRAIDELLTALRRPAEMAVALDSKLYESARAAFAKKVEPQLPKLPPGKRNARRRR